MTDVDTCLVSLVVELVTLAVPLYWTVIPRNRTALARSRSPAQLDEGGAAKLWVAGGQ